MCFYVHACEQKRGMCLEFVFEHVQVSLLTR